MSLYFREYGDKNAPTIIFLHGSGVSSWMWNEQCEALKTEYHCIALDLPANGESYREEWHSLTHAAEEVAKMIQQHSITGKAHVVGLSLGGYVGIKLLECFPEVVESLLVSGVTTAPFERQWLYRPLLKVMSHLTAWKPYSYLMAKLLQLPDDILPLYLRDNQRLTAQTLGRLFDEIFVFELAQSLKDCQQRVLAVAGEHEAAMIKTGLSRFKEVLPNAQAYLVANAHHGWNGEFPDVFNQMLFAWLANGKMPQELKPIE